MVLQAANLYKTVLFSCLKTLNSLSFKEMTTFNKSLSNSNHKPLASIQAILNKALVISKSKQWAGHSVILFSMD